MTLEILKNLPSLAVEAVTLGKRTYATREAASEWLTKKGLTDLELDDQAGAWHATVRGTDQFVADSGRDILADGALLRVGLLANAVQKGEINPLPTFQPEQLRILGELDILEVTLTAAPVLDQMAAFEVFKADAGELPEGHIEIRKGGRFHSRDDERRIVAGYALVPDLPDHQGDIVPSADVEKAAHSLLRNVAKGMARGEGAGLEHRAFDGIGYPVESSIDRAGEHGVAGGWRVAVRVEDDAVWDSVCKGELRGFSIGGRSARRELIADLGTVLKAKFEDVEKADLAFNEIRSAVGKAIRARHVDEFAWIEAIFADRVVYHHDGTLWQAMYSIDDDGAVTLNDSEEVRVEFVAKAWPGAPTPLKTRTTEEPQMTAEEVKKAIADGIAAGVAKAKPEPAEPPAADPAATTEAATTEPPAGETTLKSIDGKIDELLEQVKKHGDAIDDHAQRIDTIAGQPVTKGGGLQLGGAVTVGKNNGKTKSEDDESWGHPIWGAHGRPSNH